MKTLTINQPWASLIAVGAKRFETRGWKTSYRGLIVIHAGIKLERPYPIVMFKPTMDALNLQNFKEVDNLPRGAVIATAELIGCWEIALNQGGAFLCVPYGPGIPDDFERVIPRTSNEYLFGDFTPGDYAWEFTNVVMLREPIPARGQQRLWNWDMPSWLSSRYKNEVRKSPLG